MPGKRQGQDSNDKINDYGEKIGSAQTKRACEPEPPCQAAEGSAEGIYAIEEADTRTDDFVGICNRPDEQRQGCTHEETGNDEDSKR